MAPARYDAYLDAVAAFPSELPRSADGRVDWTALPIEAIRTRRWSDRPAKLCDVDRDQVTGMREAFPRMLRIGYEIEDPWQAYTIESNAYMDSAGVQKLAGF